jgi:hypothetical protein
MLKLPGISWEAVNCVCLAIFYLKDAFSIATHPNIISNGLGLVEKRFLRKLKLNKKYLPKNTWKIKLSCL